MKRKTSTTPSQIWTFGIYKPLTHADKVHEQLKLANVYYNKLIEIERARRLAYREARTAIGLDLARYEAEREKLTAEIDKLRTEIKDARKEARSRLEDAARNKRITELRALRKLAHEKVKAEREVVNKDPVLIARSDAINEVAKDAQKLARKESGLYWGTYLLIERQVEQARKSKADPKFRRFMGTGRVGVQIQGGIKVPELFGSDTRIQLDPLPPETWDTRSGRRHARSNLRIRIGSEGIRPIFAEFKDVLVHRKLPDDGRIMWAWVKISRIGPRTVYELQLTLESTSFEKKAPPKGTERIAAIDIGWRALPTGNIRIGYLCDVFSKRRELVLTGEIRDQLAKASSLVSINDGHFNTARAVLKDWAKEHPDLVPEAIREDLTTMHAWHRRGRLSRVARLLAEGYRDQLGEAWDRWKAARLTAREDLFAGYDELSAFAATCTLTGTPTFDRIMLYLDFWRRKELHLWTWETNLRTRALRRRKDIYRNWASELGREYAVVVLETLDLRAFSEAPEAEEKDERSSTERRHRAAVAPQELRQALVSCLGRNRVATVPAENTTRDHSCGHRNSSELFKLEQDAAIVVTCEGCGVEYDQDEQAAKTILDLYLAEQLKAAQG